MHLQMIGKLVLVAFFMSIASGCTSISSSQYSQYVHVLPKNHSNVEIEGQNLGSAPGYFEVPRGRRPKMILRAGELSQEVHLETTYRWSSSFFSGLIFGAYAPLAWLVDILTGTAWDVMDYSEPGAEPPHSKDFRVAIAPPKANSKEISDLGGEWLFGNLSQVVQPFYFPGYKGRPQVRSYSDTLPTFLTNDYVFDIFNSDQANSRKLYKHIDSEVIVESQIKKTEDRYLLESYSVNLLTGEKKAGPSWEFKKDELSRKIPGLGTKIKDSWLTRLIPNTVGVDIVSERLEVQLAQSEWAYELRPVERQDWFSKGLNYISSLNFSNSPDRRREFVSKWEFSAVPLLRLSRKHVSAVDLPIPGGDSNESESQFIRWLVTGGYGLEIGYLNGRHFFYLDVVPTFVWSEISWQQNGAEKTVTRTGLSSQAEIGYTYNWRSDWLIKIFSRSQAEQTEIWKDALSSRLGAIQYPVSASTQVAGLTIAYQFESFELEDRRSRR